MINSFHFENSESIIPLNPQQTQKINPNSNQDKEEYPLSGRISQGDDGPITRVGEKSFQEIDKDHRLSNTKLEDQQFSKKLTPDPKALKTGQSSLEKSSDLFLKKTFPLPDQVDDEESAELDSSPSLNEEESINQIKESNKTEVETPADEYSTEEPEEENELDSLNENEQETLQEKQSTLEEEQSNLNSLKLEANRQEVAEVTEQEAEVTAQEAEVREQEADVAETEGRTETTQLHGANDQLDKIDDQLHKTSEKVETNFKNDEEDFQGSILSSTQEIQNDADLQELEKPVKARDLLEILSNIEERAGLSFSVVRNYFAENLKKLPQPTLEEADKALQKAINRAYKEKALKHDDGRLYTKNEVINLYKEIQKTFREYFISLKIEEPKKAQTSDTRTQTERSREEKPIDHVSPLEDRVVVVKQDFDNKKSLVMTKMIVGSERAREERIKELRQIKYEELLKEILTKEIKTEELKKAILKIDNLNAESLSARKIAETTVTTV